MNETSDAARLYTERLQSYLRFVHAVAYPQGLRAYFLASPLLRDGLRVLVAGCGTGIVTLALRDAFRRRGLTPAVLNGFDLTPAMLDRFRATLRERSIDDVAIVQADVLRLENLPAAWTSYDLIVSASMLEYVARDRFADALRGMRRRLAKDGTLLLFITRRNWLMRPLIGKWWLANLYTRAELADSFSRAGLGVPRLGGRALARAQGAG